ncbi:MAG: pilus assembly protein [Proteobacteria bacterium]|nr:pilus assembly protein [Pseudomonadota bacterium]
MSIAAWKRRITGRFFTFRKNESGATALEFGLIAVPFFAFLFAIIETGIAFLNGQYLDRAVEKASRQIFTGQLSQSNLTPTAKMNKFKSDVCDLLGSFMDCGRLYYDVQAYPTFGAPIQPVPMSGGGLDTTALPRFNPGASGEIVVARVYYLQPIYADILGAGLANNRGTDRLLIGTAVFRNEPF